MKTVTIKARTDKDGIVRLEIPVLLQKIEDGIKLNILGGKMGKGAA